VSRPREAGDSVLVKTERERNHIVSKARKPNGKQTPKAQPRRSGFAANAVNACCVGTLFLYAVQRRIAGSLFDVLL
jgi:hypothetical protein